MNSFTQNLSTSLPSSQRNGNKVVHRAWIQKEHLRYSRRLLTLIHCIALSSLWTTSARTPQRNLLPGQSN